MSRRQYPLQQVLCIDTLYTFHYYELSKSFRTTGELHDFWEFVYVDKGELELFTDSRRFLLSQGDVVFLQPNLFHGVEMRDASSLLIVSFDSRDPCMSHFDDTIVQLEKDEQQMLTALLQEASHAFDPPIFTLLYPRLGRNVRSPYGAEHLIKNYIEIFLIKLLRRLWFSANTSSDWPLLATGETRHIDLFRQIDSYMKRHLSLTLTLEQLSSTFHISRTQLKTLFRETAGIGAIHYFNLLKIDDAKRMIREERHTLTEIASQLGYSSIHYFSSSFKKMTNMTPTEYARTVLSRMARLETPQSER